MDAFEALADPVRRALLARLARGSARVVDLAADYPISRPAISKHLRLLTEADLVTATNHGRERHYAIRRDGLEPVQTYLTGLRPARPPIPEHALDALELEVRRTTRDRENSTAPTEDDNPTKDDREHTA
ncbi:helix-turn-helix transcriptional regulator [Gordonia sp. TBRC 11910]|uniref:Helix-turn-helix transcriptional regulator n=1 Tax=Gordonia asplenii TaxID=2725283 RepID=A0A848KX74_9ACTN|nr:metalloregulator ArsR/SmtB family transcription factor [Gordonia asplenii]NMO02687.1 helix-turn-helix transcriptional regulator [Gordonia asplenii]